MLNPKLLTYAAHLRWWAALNPSTSMAQVDPALACLSHNQRDCSTHERPGTKLWVWLAGFFQDGSWGGLCGVQGPRERISVPKFSSAQNSGLSEASQTLPGPPQNPQPQALGASKGSRTCSQDPAKASHAGASFKDCPRLVFDFRNVQELSHRVKIFDHFSRAPARRVVWPGRGG